MHLGVMHLKIGKQHKIILKFHVSYLSKEKVDKRSAPKVYCIQCTNSFERRNLYEVLCGGDRLYHVCRKSLMEAAVLTLHQVILMMLLIAVGMACAHLKWFTDEIAQALSKFLLWFVTPALLIDVFQREYDAAEARNLLLAGLLGIVFHLLAAVIAKIAIRQGDKRAAVARMSAMYSNCGFMAFPLISAVLGETGVFYGSAFVGMFNLSLWTQGRALLLGRKGITVRGALCNAGVLGTIAGALLYFCSIPLPGIADSLAASLASLNTPLAMIVIGVFLSHCSLRSLLCGEVLWPSLLRTIIIPLCYFAVLCALHVSMWGSAGGTIGTVVMLCTSCPSAASSVLMTASLGMDSIYGSRIIFMTSMLSVFTIPMFALLTNLILL